MHRTLFSFPGLCLALELVAAGACSDDGSKTDAIDYAPVVSALTQDVALPAYDRAATSGDGLVSALSTLQTSPTAATLSAAQDAWRTARAAYRQLDAFSFGPLTELAIDARIDVAPADPSGLEKIVAGSDSLDVTYVGRLGGQQKGWLGLEYLLFDTAQGQPLAQFQASARRATLARAIGEEIAASLSQLNEAWSSETGLAHELLTAGAGSTRYRSQRAAIDEFVGGGAYALEYVVGNRFAEPMGRKSTGTPDPSLDPTLASDSTKSDALATLASVRALYEGRGFSSLIAPRAAALDTEATNELNACTTSIDAIPGSFDSALTQAFDSVQAAYDACKQYKLTWNTDITRTLGATVKPLDTDGD
jgi:predicted lipoprotein